MQTAINNINATHPLQAISAQLMEPSIKTKPPVLPHVGVKHHVSHPSTPVL
jgi:hypothetical protein